MRRPQLVWISMTFAVSATLVGLAAQSLGPQTSFTTAVAAGDTSPSFEFGSVVAGQDVRHTFTLVNERDEPLKIDKVRATCGCTTTDDWTREVPAGGTWSLPVTLKTERLRGDVRKTIVVEVAEPHAERIEFALAGHVQPHFDITPSRNVIFAWTKNAQPTERKITVENLLAKPVRITKAVSSNAAFEVTLNELQAGRRYEIVARLTAGLGDEDRQSGRVTLTTTSPHQPEITLPIAAFRMPTRRPLASAGRTAGQARVTTSSQLGVRTALTSPEGKRSDPPRSRDCPPVTDPLTYGGPGVQVEYDLWGDHHWFVPVMGALARDPDEPPEDPLNWMSGVLGPYGGEYLWDEGFFYQARYQLPYGLSLGPPPYSGPIPPATTRLVHFFGHNCDCDNRDPTTAFPPTFTEAKAAADAYCAGMCGDGFTMVDFDMNQWYLTCYNFGSDSYNVATWGGTRCGKVEGQTIIECDPHTKLTQVREHLWQNPLEECPECDLDGDGVISLVDVVLARETGFMPRHRGVGLTYALVFLNGSTQDSDSGAKIDQTLDPTQFVSPEMQLIPAVYFDMTEWDVGVPVDCNGLPPELQVLLLSEITYAAGINGSLADSWCAAYGQPGATACANGSMGFQIGHCQIWPDGTQSIRVVIGYCMDCM